MKHSQEMNGLGRRSLSVLVLALIVTAMVCWMGRSDEVLAQSGEGSPLAGLTPGQLSNFTIGQGLFLKTWDPAAGLGPVFTSTGCATCHFIPATGGQGSLQPVGHQNTTAHFTTLFGTTNSDGSFNPLTNEGGPLLQQGTIQTFDFKAGACTLPGEVVPADATIVQTRLPPDLFGAGMIDAIPDSAILANVIAYSNGILGSANMVADYNGNVRPGRFGRKAQLASLLQTVGGAFGHDLGITNPVDPIEDLPQGNPIPSLCVKDLFSPNDTVGSETISLFDYLSLLAPNPLGTLSSQAQAGQVTFGLIGCTNCHTVSYTTNANVQLPSNFTGGLTTTIAPLSSQTIFPYSDFLLHDMGPGLADGIPMGQSTGSQWRTAPLWGLSKRLLHLHDGRTSSLTVAIADHGGEASTVISNYNALSPTDQTNLLAFLNSL